MGLTCPWAMACAVVPGIVRHDRPLVVMAAEGAQTLLHHGRKHPHTRPHNGPKYPNLMVVSVLGSHGVLMVWMGPVTDYLCTRNATCATQSFDFSDSNTHPSNTISDP